MNDNWLAYDTIFIKNKKLLYLYNQFALWDGNNTLQIFLFSLPFILPLEGTKIGQGPVGRGLVRVLYYLYYKLGADHKYTKAYKNNQTTSTKCQ